MKKHLGNFLLALLFSGFASLSAAPDEDKITNISIGTDSGWYARFWPDVAMVGFGSGAFETARIERPNLLRAGYAVIKPSIDFDAKSIPVGSNSIVISEGEVTRQYPLKDDAAFKNLLDILSMDWKPALKKRFAEILREKPIFENWSPSPERGRNILSKMAL